MYQGKIAIKNPAGNYRIPADRMGGFRFEGGDLFNDFFGDLADRIGAYEDCETIADVNKIRRRFGLQEIKK